MKSLSSTLAICAMLALSSFNVRSEDLRPDANGYIRDWLMLAPIVIPQRDSCAEALLREQIPHESALQPKSGDKVKVGDRELTWMTVSATTNYFDFNERLKSTHDHVAGYAVTYIECDKDIPDVVLAVASNDQGRIYFNGVDIYAFTEPRPLMLDADKGKITLKKGVNVIVFKILNEQNSWQGAMRLLTKSGAPLRDVRIRQSP